MALRCVADAVHALYDGVHRGVVTYSRVGAVEVVVDGTGQTHTAHIVCACKIHSAGERTVTAYHHQGVDALFLQGLIGLGFAFGSHKFLGAGSFEYRTARHDDTTHVLGSEVNHLVIDESIITTIDTFDIKTVTDTRTGYRSDGGVHSGGVASGCKDSDCFNFCHNLYCCFYFVLHHYHDRQTQGCAYEGFPAYIGDIPPHPGVLGLEECHSAQRPHTEDVAPHGGRIGYHAPIV